MRSDAEPFGDRVHRAGRGLFVEPLPAPEETLRVEVSEHEVGVGHGGRGSAPTVTGRPGIGAGAPRAHVQHPARVDVGNRASPGADARDVETVQRDALAGHPPVGRHGGFAVHDEGHVRARAAHVEGNQVRMLENAACVARRGHAAGRAREDAARGEPDRVSDRRETAVRLHDEHGPGIARLCQARFEAPEIALEDGSDVGIDHRRADPLEFLDLRKHLRREADVCRRHLPGERLRRDTLVLGTAPGVQEAHGNRLDLRVGEGADGRAQRATVNRRPHAPVGPDSLAHGQAQMAGY